MGVKFLCFIHNEGVSKVKADSANNKLTVTCTLEPERLRERVAYKTKKKVEVVSPQPKKDEKKGDAKPEKKIEEKVEKKPKEVFSFEADNYFVV